MAKRLFNPWTHDDKIDERNGVELDVPEEHDADHVDDDYGDDERDNEGGKEIEREQYERGEEDGDECEYELNGGVLPNGQVLLVEDVKYAEIRKKHKLQLNYIFEK